MLPCEKCGEDIGCSDCHYDEKSGLYVCDYCDENHELEAELPDNVIYVDFIAKRRVA